MTFCTSMGVEHYHNEGYSSKPISSDLKLGFSNIKASYNNRVLECSFTRLKSMPDIEKYFSLKDTKYFILTAYGLVREGFRAGSITYSKHDQRIASANAVDLESGEAPTAGVNREDLIQAHGLLMIISWLLFASTGMLFASNLKQLVSIHVA